MGKFQLNGRAVEVIETDWELGEGAWVIDACYADTGADLTDSELEQLSDLYQSEIYQDQFESAVDAACDYYEER